MRLHRCEIIELVVKYHNSHTRRDNVTLRSESGILPAAVVRRRDESFHLPLLSIDG